VKVVLDTNVVVSGLFFGGVPGQVLSAWNAGGFALVLSASILAEYREVGSELSAKNSDLDFESFAALLVMNSQVVDAPQYFESPVCFDPEDDKFLSCAAVSGAQIIVSGDRQLLAVSGWNGISVVRPRDFVERYLKTAE
jgi:putative PIN family toxin of toxin-antitoxin system